MNRAKSRTPRQIIKRPRSPHSSAGSPPSKRRVTEKLSIRKSDPSSDDEYEMIHAGYDIRYEKNVCGLLHKTAKILSLISYFSGDLALYLFLSKMKRRKN